ncbi:ATP-binding protein [Burkholderia diffusa]|uniref:ATP-binding protein n=1 Tax=Burkholderia diffusa TaxID=488732 RepID=A0AAW3PHR8_9BURK|nr:ABC transporter ATP-binding protein [Burkholderia diffusa]KUZ15114.1 ATP-binding protein [Burkholderia diffusa]KVC11753.1 ATP-binding protein [Burkholderia diffusa]KVM91094.1 ATP-binding protein [Burkholderia diffusa]KWF34526.1 ATP-binding protein [Burkholderia diffusa]KWF47746.1 ATP-binding protein [Burkholderia diffusa]
MISLRDICRVYHTRSGPRMVLKGVDFDIHKGCRYGVLGRNGSGKSTLLRIVGGTEPPTSGSIVRQMTVSWPLAFTGAFQGSLTGVDNVKFVSRIYGVNPLSIMPFIEDFTEIGAYLREPLKTYSSGMRARLAFAISMAIEFDCFLIDEVIAVGDSRFHEKCRHELFVKRRDRALVIVSHDPHLVQTYCDEALVLTDGRMTRFEHMSDAYDFYQRADAAIQG